MRSVLRLMSGGLLLLALSSPCTPRWRCHTQRRFTQDSEGWLRHGSEFGRFAPLKFPVPSGRASPAGRRRFSASNATLANLLSLAR